MSPNRLHLAATANDADEIRRLLLCSDPSTTIDSVDEDSNGQTALHVACSLGNFEAVKCLVDAGSDVNLQDSSGDTPLHAALTNSHLVIETYLRLNPVTDRSKANRDGQTPLHKAVLARLPKETIIALLESSYDNDAKDNCGLSPFHVAVAEGRVEQAQAFLEVNKGTINQVTADGETPLNLAIRRDGNEEEAVPYLIDVASADVKNNRIANSSNGEMIRCLIEAGADLDSIHGKFGTGALWLAADLQREKVVEIIVQSKNFESRSAFAFGQEDSLPFLISLARGNRRITRMLFENAGLKLRILFGDFNDGDDDHLDDFKENFRDEHGNTALHLAVLSDSVRAVKKILPLCHDKNGARNDQGKTASDLAAERGRSEIIDFLQANWNTDCNTGLSQISQLSEKYPAFCEFEEPWFKLEPDAMNNISLEDLERYIIAPIDIDWRKSGEEQHRRGLRKHGWHVQRAPDKDNRETCLIKDVLKIMCDVESYLNDTHKVFRHLGVEFLPAGSVVEGTRIGLLNEMDFMVNFSKLSGRFVIRDEMSLVMRMKREIKDFHWVVRELFDSDGRLNVRRFFVMFIEAVGEAVDHLQQVPEGIKICRSYKRCRECSDKTFVMSVWSQCVHQLTSPPAVCFTKVGAGLNFIVDNSTIFTVDLVLSFKGMLKFHSGTAELRRYLVEHLLEENPPGWRDFLLKFIIGERASLEQFEQSRGEITVGVKMVDYNGNFVLRPGLALEVPETFSSEIMRKAYCVLKLLKFLSNGSIKSYDLKKVMYQLKKKKKKKEREADNDSCTKIVNAVVEHRDVKGKMSGICDQLSSSFDGIDLDEFPKMINGKKHLHFVHKRANRLRRAVVENADLSEIRSLAEEMVDEEAYSIAGSYPLHWACAPPARPSAEVIEILVRSGCSVVRMELQCAVTPLELLMCNTHVSASSLQTLLAAIEEEKENLQQEDKLGLLPLKFGIRHLSETDSHCDLLETLFRASVPTGKTSERLLIAACMYGKPRFAALLLSVSAHLSATSNIAADRFGHTPMHYAAVTGNVALLELLPKDSVNAADHLGETSLMKASRLGHLEMMKGLVSRGARVLDKDKAGLSPLLHAAMDGSTEAVKMLLDLGADPLDAAADGTTLLGLAASEGKLENVQLVLSAARGHDIIDQANICGHTPLILASSHGHTDIVRELLRLGASVEKTMANGFTALHESCARGHDDAARILLRAGSDIDKVASDGETPLHLACSRGHLSTARLLLEEGADTARCDTLNTTPFDVACMEGHDDIVRLLISVVGDRLDVDRTIDQGANALDVAIAKGHVSTIRLLCEEAGADLDRVDERQGLTRLQRACTFNQVETVRVLIRAGADVNRIGDARGWTPLLVASVSGHMSIVRMLLDAGANPTARCASGLTAFNYLLMRPPPRPRYTEDIAALLLRTDPTVAASRLKTWSPLHEAIRRGELFFVDILLEAGADVEAVDDKEGKTCLEWACATGRLDVIERLVTKGKADVNHLGEFCTPLLAAAINGHVDAVTYLLSAGADMGVRTARDQALKRGFTEIADLLTPRATIGLESMWRWVTSFY